LAGDKRTHKFSLVGGLVTLIALGVLSFGTWGIWNLVNEVHELRSQGDLVKKSVDAQTYEIKQLLQKVDKFQGRLTISIPTPEQPGFPPSEPHIAVDPENSERVILAAMYAGQVGTGEKSRGASRVLTWQSDDGGRTWSKPLAPLDYLKRPEGRLGADPVIAFGPGKICWFSGCDYDWHSQKPNYSSVKVTLSQDDGKTWQKPTAATELDNNKHGKGTVDKPWLAVDRSQGKYRGTVYVAWTRFDEERNQVDLYCAASPQGSGAFSEAVRLGESIALPVVGNNPGHQVQLATRPDGTLDAVWRMAPSGSLMHASSQDGGTTFSKAALIAPLPQDERSSVGQFPSLIATADGKLLAAWAGHGADVLCSVLANGRWSRPRSLVAVPATRSVLSHPAAAATAGSLWVLSYRTETSPSRVSVVLYRSTDEGNSWKEDQVIASRKLAEGLPSAFSPGDYVGLAAANGRVYAAYVLPGEDHIGAKPQLYVTAFGVTREP
jgi:hypothetical protein